MSERDVDVAIVGAGLAGLSAARTLKSGGASVTVLEARDRVGGRTLTEGVGGAAFDLGAQWLGPTQTKMAKLVAEFGLETFPTYTRGRKVLEVNGKLSTYKGTIPSMAPHRLLLLNSGLNRMEKLAKQVPLDAPWDSKHAVTWDGQTVESFKRARLPSKAVRDVVDAAIRTIFGADPSEVSLLYFLFYLRSGGGLMSLVEIENGAQETRFVDGSQSVSKALARDLGDSVSLSTPVDSIQQDDEGVRIESGSARVHAKRVIVAVPPALAGRINYEPGMPGIRDELTQRHPMGATIKSHVIYEDPFWREEGFSGEAVYTSGPVDVAFDNCSHDMARPALLVFSCGSKARRLGAMSPQDRRKDVVEALVQAFGAKAANPVDYIDKDWSDDPWTRGCPTGFMPPGVMTTFGRALREPVGRIHWAGTETSTRWAGYMEGAVESGERAAGEVLAAL